MGMLFSEDIHLFNQGSLTLQADRQTDRQHYYGNTVLCTKVRASSSSIPACTVRSTITEVYRAVKINKLCDDDGLLKISAAGRYAAVFSKPTVYNTVTFNIAIFF